MAARKPKRGKRDDRPVQLAAELEQLVATYVRAAAAAGVGLAVTALSAEAKIVYTRTHAVILENSLFPLDLNHDGTADFNIINGSLYAYGSFSGLQIDSPSKLQTNQIWGQGVLSGRFASALRAGSNVGANKSRFQARNSALMAGIYVARYSSFSRTSGQWLYTKNRYLGLQFVIKGQLHYGWARLSVRPDPNSGLTVVLTGYAYETIPGKPIITGKTKGPDVVTLDPATLGHLAQGASQIPAWRMVRNKSAAAEGSR
jgi:hypothetical protein